MRPLSREIVRHRPRFRRRDSGWSAEHDESARTWAVEIAAVIQHADPITDGDEYKFGGGAALSINKTGKWYCFGDHEGGISALSLIRHLYPKFSREDAVVWGLAFLQENPGTGAFCTGADGDDTDDTAAQVGRDIAKRIRNEMLIFNSGRSKPEWHIRARSAPFTPRPHNVRIR